MIPNIKVLMVCSNLSVADGVASFAMNYFKCMDQSKIHIDFAIYHDIPSVHYEEIGKTDSKIFVLPELKHILKHIKECKRIIREGNYDIIHNNTINVSLPLMLIAKIQKVPARIIHSHNSKFGEGILKEYRNRLLFFLMKQTATGFAACSELAGRKIFGREKFALIPNVIEGTAFQFDRKLRVQIRKKMGVKDKIVIGSVGRVAKQKNPLFALDIVSELIKTNDKIEYWWIGSGPLDSSFLIYAEQKGIKEKVKLLGSRSDVPDLYQAMDLLIMPSRFEGFGIACIEAQAMGLPCVVSDVLPQDVAYTDLVAFCSLKKCNSIWISEINTQIQKIDQRKSRIPDLEISPYSSNHSGDFLKHYYTSLLETT